MFYVRCMKMRLLFFFVLLLAGKASSAQKITAADSIDRVTGVSGADIYSLMDVFFADTNVRITPATARFARMPMKSIVETQADSVYLRQAQVHKREAEEEEKKAKPAWYFAPIYVGDMLLDSLSETDIRFMLRQNMRLNQFQWDTTRWHFSKSGASDLYEISIPLFSKDKTIALIGVEHSCPGLCGVGYVYRFVKKKGRWVYDRSVVDHFH